MDTHVSSMGNQDQLFCAYLWVSVGIHRYMYECSRISMKYGSPRSTTIMVHGYPWISVGYPWFSGNKNILNINKPKVGGGPCDGGICCHFDLNFFACVSGCRHLQGLPKLE